MYLIALLLASSLEASAPSVPYLDWGACPFECCAYGVWKAEAAIPVYSTRNAKGRPIATIAKGRQLEALTGVVVTPKAGRWQVLQAITLGEDTQVSLAPGDVIYPLHNQGEGYVLFWFRGATYSAQLSDPDPTYFRILEDPEEEWWVKVGLGAGKVGWVSGSAEVSGNSTCE
jgi:hypothetical protein